MTGDGFLQENNDRKLEAMFREMGGRVRSAWLLPQCKMPIGGNISGPHVIAGNSAANKIPGQLPAQHY